MKNQKTLAELREAAAQFFPKVQLQLITDACFDHENDDWKSNQQYYRNLLQGFADTFQNMPKTYETTSLGGNAIAYLHYFVGACDWWITEKDIEEEQLQAFGVVKLGHNRPELGYINLVELDFHWQPKRLMDIPNLESLFNKK